MLIARIGCQLSALMCWNLTPALHSAALSSKASCHHLLSLLASDALAALFQMVHLPVGFQVRMMRSSPFCSKAFSLLLLVSAYMQRALCVLAIFVLRMRLNLVKVSG